MLKFMGKKNHQCIFFKDIVYCIVRQLEAGFSLKQNNYIYIQYFRHAIVSISSNWSIQLLDKFLLWASFPSSHEKQQWRGGSTLYRYSCSVCRQDWKNYSSIQVLLKKNAKLRLPLFCLFFSLSLSDKDWHLIAWFLLCLLLYKAGWSDIIKNMCQCVWFLACRLGKKKNEYSHSLMCFLIN